MLQKTVLIMSPEAVAALVGGALAVAGTLIGALVTVWLGPRYLRRLQRSGKVRYRLSDLAWNEKLKFGDENSSLGYTFSIKVFNERGLGTGIRDVEVKFIDTKGKEITNPSCPLSQ
jgi:hypothetical protein